MRSENRPFWYLMVIEYLGFITPREKETIPEYFAEFYPKGCMLPSQSYALCLAFSSTLAFISHLQCIRSTSLTILNLDLPMNTKIWIQILVLTVFS